MHLDGVGFRRLARVVLGRPGGVRRVGMGAKGRGGAGLLIGGENGSFYSVVAWIEDGFNAVDGHERECVSSVS